MTAPDEWTEQQTAVLGDLAYDKIIAERDAARAEAAQLREQIKELTTCDCGLPLSVGKCGVCDRDE